MNTKEHKLYLDEFKAFSREVVSSEQTAKEFLVRTGIHTRTGRLAKAYSTASIRLNGKK